MLKIYKITRVQGQLPPGSDLVGLLIEETDDGFYVVSVGEPHDPPRILARSNLFQLNQKPLLTFEFPYREHHWTLTVNDISALEMKGKWRPGPEEDEDSWVATGGGAGVPGEDEARAANV